MENEPPEQPSLPQDSTEWASLGSQPPPVSGELLVTIAPDAGSSESNPGKSPRAKRKRGDKERTRVSRACDRCKKKKTRCTGRYPCPLCLKAGLACEFTASYTRGRLPSVAIDEAALTLAQPRASLPATLSTSETPSTEGPSPFFRLHKPPVTPSIEAPSTDNYLEQDQSNLSNGDSSARDPPSRTSPEPAQTDQEGHFIGPASGASFLLRIQKRLHTHESTSQPYSSTSSIFTNGDPPLPSFDPTFFVLPPKADAEKLVERYFDFAAPTHRFLHRPSIEAMLEEFYEKRGELGGEGSEARTALLMVVLAQARAYMPGVDLQDDSARYYFASEHQLSKERGAVRLASVQARLGQCFYLLTQSRINHCWSLFGTMAHLAFAIGLNRGRRYNPSAKVDYIELESRRRLFWVAYGLDKYLAAALGRPRTFKDEDIDQEFPTVINDHNLHPHTMITAPTSPHEIPVMMAPIEHIKLSRIVSHVLRDLYALRPPPLASRLRLTQHYTASLHSWRSNLTRFLDVSADLPSSLLIPIYQRQRNVLNLAYYHAEILVHRPFLLSNFASLTHFDAAAAPSSSKSPTSPTAKEEVATREHVQACLSAAMGIVGVVDDMNGSEFFRAFWFTQYYAFCAVVVLYIYRIQQGITEPGKCRGYLAAGERCQAILASISRTDCLASRYCVVLEELRLEAVRAQGRGGGGGEGAEKEEDAKAVETVPAEVFGLSSVPHEQQFEAAGSLLTPDSAWFGADFMAPDSIMADLTSWGQFDGLVNGGMGMFDGGFQMDGGAGLGFG